MFAVVVTGLYAIIYAAPRIEGIGIRTDVIQYDQLPIADNVTALFVRDETLFTAAYSGYTNYMVVAGTKVRAGTQVVYIEPGAEPAFVGAAHIPPDEGVPLSGSGDDDGVGIVSRIGSVVGTGSVAGAGSAGAVRENPYEALLRMAGNDAVESEGGVTPWTAIVSYYGDGWEKRVTPENIMDLRKAVLVEAPGEAVDLTREWARAGEPVYRITNNNLWRVAFWIDNADKTVLDKYQIGKKVTLDLGTTKVRANVEATEPQGRDLFVVLRSDMYYKDLDRYRVRDLSVVFSEVSGAVIEKKAVKLKSGTVGVYVKQQSGVFKWVPVKVLKESGDFYLIAETYYEDGDGKRVPTIRYYDEIMSNPAAEGY